MALTFLGFAAGGDTRAPGIGASEGIRTLDIHVGNVTLYQTELRSLPKKARQTYRSERGLQVLFRSNG